eukprot:3595409-Amphidinium_carterae.1
MSHAWKVGYPTDAFFPDAGQALCSCVAACHLERSGPWPRCLQTCNNSSNSNRHKDHLRQIRRQRGGVSCSKPNQTSKVSGTIVALLGRPQCGEAICFRGSCCTGGRRFQMM